LNEAAQASFENNYSKADLIYNPRSASCAMLLRHTFAARGFELEKYNELCFWANRIDAAIYASVEEALFGWGNPAAEVNLTLAVDANDSYAQLLLREFRVGNLESAAALSEVKNRLVAIRERTKIGVELLQANSALTAGGIIVSDIKIKSGESVNRYTPYAVYPDAKYS
jgi:hypothetical protein